VGRDLVSGDEQQHYFQQYARYATGERFDGTRRDWPDVERYGANEMKLLFEYEAADVWRRSKTTCPEALLAAS